MKKNRPDQRVEVNFPVVCTLENRRNKKLLSEAKLSNMSINGMKIDIPLPPNMLKQSIIDIDLNLPQPFAKIRSHGKIKWKKWQKDKKHTSCGVKLEPLTLKQLFDLHTIIDEVSAENNKK